MTYPGITKEWDKELFPQEVKRIVNNILNGKLNATGTFTVTNGTTTTTIEDRNCTADSVILWMALDADSSDTTSFYISDRDKFEFTITHDNSVNDRNYSYVIIG